MCFPLCRWVNNPNLIKSIVFAILSPFFPLLNSPALCHAVVCGTRVVRNYFDKMFKFKLNHKIDAFLPLPIKHVWQIDSHCNFKWKYCRNCRLYSADVTYKRLSNFGCFFSRAMEICVCHIAIVATIRIV